MIINRWNGVPILMYHYLGTPVDVDDAPYYVSKSTFFRHMQFLRNGGYKAITLNHLMKYIKEENQTPKRSVAITFDDGHESFETIGVPILERFGYTATMFVITSRVNTPGYLSKESIVSLRDRGIQFESHSHNHSILTNVSDQEIKHEISMSKIELELITGKEVRFFAYRGGHYNENIQKLLREAGYKAAVCSSPGLNSENSDFFALQRMGVRGEDNLGKFARKLLGLTVYRNSVAYLIHYLRL